MELDLLSCPTYGAEHRADDLEKRLIRFAIDIVALTGKLPQNFKTKVLRRSYCVRVQLRLRTTVKQGRRRAGRISLQKELNKTSVWLRIAQGSFETDGDFLTQLIV